MTRITRRSLERSLRAPAPEPDAELGRRIKSQIPGDLLAARTDRSAGQPGAISSPEEPAATPVIAAAAARSRRRALVGGPGLALAASVVVAIGASYLAARLFRERAELAPSEAVVARAENERVTAPRLDRVSALDDTTAAAPKSEKEALGALEDATGAAANGLRAAGELVPAPAEYRQEPAAQPQANRELDAEVDALAPSEVPEPPVADELSPSRPSPSVAGERDLERAAGARAVEVPPADERERGNDVPAAPSGRLALQVARKSDLQAESGAAVGDAASRAAAAGGSNAHVADRYVDAVRQPISTVTVAGDHGDRDSFAAKVPARVEDAQGIAGGELLEAAAASERRAESLRSTIAVSGTAARTPDRLLLLVSAPIENEDAGEARSSRESESGEGAILAIELAFDPALVRRYRLLASHVDQPAVAASSADRAPAPAATPRRIVALYEIELARALDAGSVLATARLQSAGGGARPDRSRSRTIDAGDFASDSDLRTALLALAQGAGAPEATAVPEPAALKARVLADPP